MEILQQIQEQYIQEFSNNVSISEFLINIFITAILITLLRLYYIRFGNSISNRRKFANNFLPLALGTLLIIMIVKSSIALSLGLVGALSIVRYRAAIKDPEELTFLFIAIGIGLAGGANQPVLAVLAFSIILLLLYLSRLIHKQSLTRQEGRLFVNINTDLNELEQITAILKAIFPYVELKRLDTQETGLDLTFICKANTIEDISALQKQIGELSANTHLSIIDQPDLIL
jgi:lysylphosphatidylglycerol synthetase-like protein (DUF2156 family)